MALFFSFSISLSSLSLCVSFLPSNSPMVGTLVTLVSLFFLKKCSGFFQVGLSPTKNTYKGRPFFLHYYSNFPYRGAMFWQSGHQLTPCSLGSPVKSITHLVSWATRLLKTYSAWVMGTLIIALRLVDILFDIISNRCILLLLMIIDG